MRRGDLVTVALQGDQGKPRPALVVQADQFAGLQGVTVLPLTGMLMEAPLLRIEIEPLGVVLAHDRALRTDKHVSLVPQLPLALVMIAYTVGGLGLLFGGG